MEKRVQNYAKKTFLAIDNPYRSVKKVYPNSIDHITETTGYYMGVKEVKSISAKFIAELEEQGYVYHTVDKASLSGRAIDLDLINPLTGNYMTGSSSGTALNVFLGINDLGIGTDGGGSVLAPAMSLNLCGFIHPDLGNENVENKEVKVSTDGISFSPSVGLISKDLEHIEAIMMKRIDKKATASVSIGMDQAALSGIELLEISGYENCLLEMTDKYSKDRNELIADLNKQLDMFDIVVSKEGPVDVTGFGDTIFGHFSEETRHYQQLANKGYLRVANMVNAVTLSVPTTQLGEGYVLMTKNEAMIPSLFSIGKALSAEKDELIERYFGELSKYFDMGL
ncbi:amidase family protein [Vagococcus sp.]|uniref:amidase family protein n=1 Tax=Vagococcus sp. TaxID=1933889 RepID=UPI002FC58F16